MVAIAGPYHFVTDIIALACVITSEVLVIPSARR
jgi:hypothetical protein